MQKNGNAVLNSFRFYTRQNNLFFFRVRYAQISDLAYVKLKKSAVCFSMPISVFSGVEMKTSEYHSPFSEYIAIKGFLFANLLDWPLRNYQP